MFPPSSRTICRPYGFDVWNDRQLKRAGLDYWKAVDIVEHDSVDAFLHVLPLFDHAVFFSKHAKYGSTPLTEHVFPRQGSIALMFGSEV